jgi:hypothetical protein
MPWGRRGPARPGVKLLCRLGLHKPAGAPVWNAGYLFSPCRRCGVQLVRPAGGRWQRPRGHRVVWKSKAEAASHILLSDGSPNASRPSPDELPIQEVLRLLNDFDFMEQQGRATGWDQGIKVASEEALARLDRSDFMAPSAGNVPAAEAPDGFDPPAKAKSAG